MPMFLKYAQRNKKPKVIIYYLSDPDTGEIFYVGKTENHLNQRLNGHISKARKHPEFALSSRIISIMQRGKRPNIEAIEIVNQGEWESAETFWITNMREKGHRLLNIDAGGRGW
jgi:hypothetical protein